MANINKLITLTEKGKSGPYYDILYSTDCSTYIIASDGNNVYLPSIGSTAVVTIPDTTTCIKVTSTGECTNSVISGSVPTTTTTTTTTAASGDQFFTYRVVRVSSTSPVSVTYTDPYYESQTHTWSSGIERFIVARSIDASSNATVTQLSNESRPFIVSSSAELDLDLAFDTTVSNTNSSFQHLYYIDYNTGLPAIDYVISGEPGFSDCVVSGSLMLGSGTETSTGTPLDSYVSWSFGSSCVTTTTTTTTTTPPIPGTQYGTHTANIPGTVIGNGNLVWSGFNLGARNWIIDATGESSPIQGTWYTIVKDGADVYSSAGFHISDISTTISISKCKWFYDGVETVVSITDCATTGSQLYSTDNFYYDFYV